MPFDFGGGLSSYKKSETNRKNGANDGLSTGWYENGQKKGEGSARNNKLEGTVTSWYENGQKESESRYKDGKQNGLEIRWNESGTKISELVWKNGEQIQKPQKSTAISNDSVCESISDLAESAMKARQEGVPMSKLMKHNSQSENPQLIKISNYLLIEAYEKPRFSGDEYKTKSIEDFRDKAYLDCVKAAR